VICDLPPKGVAAAMGHNVQIVSRGDEKYNDHPVFRLAGIVIPVEQVRGFVTWFYQRKCQWLKWEIDFGNSKCIENISICD
jgi:hypothetical protein